MNIELVCIDILKLLLLKKEKEWSKSFKYIIDNYKMLTSDEIKRTIRSFYKGMGSFNDLVLYYDNKVCIADNEKLDLLRKELFRLINE